MRLAAVMALLILAIVVPSLSVNSAVGQTRQATFYSQGDLIVRVIFPTPPVTDWQTSQSYSVTFQIMNNGTFNLPNEENRIPTGNLSISAKIGTMVITQSAVEVGVSYGSFVNGSLMEVAVNGWNYNSTKTSWNIKLPQDNEWHTLGTVTCYYEPPALQQPSGQLEQVSIQFDVKVYEELVDSFTPTPAPTGGISFYETYLIDLGYSQTVIPIYNAPTPTATPTLPPTAMPTVTPTQTQSSINDSTPTPTVPEFSLAIILMLISAVTLTFLITAKKRKRL